KDLLHREGREDRLDRKEFLEAVPPLETREPHRAHPARREGIKQLVAIDSRARLQRRGREAHANIIGRIAMRYHGCAHPDGARGHGCERDRHGSDGARVWSSPLFFASAAHAMRARTLLSITAGVSKTAEDSRGDERRCTARRGG